MRARARTCPLRHLTTHILRTAPVGARTVRTWASWDMRFLDTLPAATARGFIGVGVAGGKYVSRDVFKMVQGAARHRMSMEQLALLLTNNQYNKYMEVSWRNVRAQHTRGSCLLSTHVCARAHAPAPPPPHWHAALRGPARYVLFPTTNKHYYHLLSKT